MFSVNPFPQLPSSTNGTSPPDSFYYQEKDDPQYNSSGDLLFHAYTSFAPPPILENVTRIDQDIVRKHQFSEGHPDLLDAVISPYRQRFETSKKDGHSKIYTARGPRDRRVRLSIDIARKFFFLQELLGFEKASETLDWLFSKSVDAINELVEETSCTSSKVTLQSKLAFLETINGVPEKKPVQHSKKKNTTRRCKAGFQEDLARDQSRTEARARARERTIEKMRVKMLENDLNTLVPDCSELGGFWAQNEPKNDYKDITWECIMDQESSKQSKDSSFRIKTISGAARTFNGSCEENFD